MTAQRRHGAHILGVAASIAGLVGAGLGFGAAPPIAPSAAAPLLVVSPTGSDQATGSASSPLRTIQTAVRRLPEGGRIELRGGAYHQRVRLVGVHGVTLTAYPGEHPVLDGSGLTPPRGLTALVEIGDSTGVTVSDLELTGYWTDHLGVVPAGVYIHGHDVGITIAGNHVHDLGNRNGTLGSFDINAHGIAAYGDDPDASISQLTIRDNVVDHLRLGASETVVVNGNVDGWVIARNQIRDDDNIGVDAIGFEPTLTGPHRYTLENRARNGVIADNQIARIRSRGNPAYWEGGSGAAAWCNCADGIYVDGGTHITVSGNRVSDSDIGIEVAAENPHGSADHVLVTHNAVTGSLFTGLTTGGYCNGADDCGGVQTGSSFANVFTGNYLRGNNRLDDGSPELLVQYYSSHDTFTDNTIIATNRAHVVYGTVPGGRSDQNVSNGNLFGAIGAGPSGAEFGWSGHTYGGFAAYRRATGQDRGSVFRSGDAGGR